MSFGGYPPGQDGYRSPEQRNLYEGEKLFGCEYCKAKPGEKCVRVGGSQVGRPTDTMHQSRKDQWHEHRDTQPREYKVFVPPEELPKPESRVYGIEWVLPADVACSRDVADILDAVLEEMRAIGSAEIVRDDQLESDFATSCKVLAQRSRVLYRRKQSD